MTRSVQEIGDNPRTSEPLRKAPNPGCLGDASGHRSQKRNPQIPQVRCTGGQAGRPRRAGTQHPETLNPLSRPVEAGSHQLPRGPAIAPSGAAGVCTHPALSSALTPRCPPGPLPRAAVAACGRLGAERGLKGDRATLVGRRVPATPLRLLAQPTRAASHLAVPRRLRPGPAGSLPSRPTSLAPEEHAR